MTDLVQQAREWKRKRTLTDQVVALAFQVESLSARNARLEAALRFYADPGNYLSFPPGEEDVAMDGGAKARAALADTEGEQAE